MAMDYNILKGMIYGEIIGSPYVQHNTSNRYFDLGTEVRVGGRGGGREKVFKPHCDSITLEGLTVARWMYADRENLNPQVLADRMTETIEHHKSAARWSLDNSVAFIEHGEYSADSYTAMLRALPLLRFERDSMSSEENLEYISSKAAEVVGLSTSNEDTIGLAQALIDAGWRMIHGEDMEKSVEKVALMYGLDLNVTADELNHMLHGDVKIPAVTAGGVEMEGVFTWKAPEGVPVISSSSMVTAALWCMKRSDSWEDAVRRSVALGGPSDALAAITAVLATAAYKDIPANIDSKLYTYLPMGERDLSTIENFHKARFNAAEQVSQASVQDNGEAVKAILDNARNELFIIVPDDRKDIRTAIADTFNLGDAARIELETYNEDKVETQEVDGEVKEVVVREKSYKYSFKSASGVEVTVISEEEYKKYTEIEEILKVAPGTIWTVSDHLDSLEEARVFDSIPEEIALTLKDGRLSATPLGGLTAKTWITLRDRCVEMQKELNAKAGNPGKGQVFYPDAYYPIIKQRSIDFYIGAINVGGFYIGADGNIHCHHGEFRTIGEARAEEYRAEAWKSQSIFRDYHSYVTLANMQEYFEDLGRVLLDEGVGKNEMDKLIDRSSRSSEEEDQARILHTNGDHLEKISNPLAMDRMNVIRDNINYMGTDVSKVHKKDRREADATVYSMALSSYTGTTIPRTNHPSKEAVELIKSLNVAYVLDIRRDITDGSPEAENIRNIFGEAGIEYCAVPDLVGYDLPLPKPKSAAKKAQEGLVGYDPAEMMFKNIRKDENYIQCMADIESIIKDDKKNVLLVDSGAKLVTSRRFLLCGEDLYQKGLEVKYIEVPPKNIKSEGKKDARNISIIDHLNAQVKAVSDLYFKKGQHGGIRREDDRRTFEEHLREALESLRSEVYRDELKRGRSLTFKN